VLNHRGDKWLYFVRIMIGLTGILLFALVVGKLLFQNPIEMRWSHSRSSVVQTTYLHSLRWRTLFGVTYSAASIAMVLGALAPPIVRKRWRWVVVPAVIAIIGHGCLSLFS
jgi:uncharacterized BrkB/YihY/UPF0761 family membrane protein